MITKWTESMVETHLEEAASTLRRLPPVKVTGYFSVWPQIIHDIYDKQDWEKQVVRRGPPSAQEISRMEETLTWFRFLTPEENRLIWLRANGVGWKAVCWRIGCCRRTAFSHWVYALAKVAFGLNNK